ncbi:Rid family hydrolase [Kordiimonas aquimaris]|uniref:Rid family hydrolase n=1 Tax=Kordiimonas aquimaris TaxID=707591 RepID=UPI0021D1E3D8|nr:Rid family hydrolase [Kordiimonas aquimaris]
MKKIFLAGVLGALISSTVFAQGSRQGAVPLIPDNWQNIYEEYGFAPALKVGDTIYVSGMIVRLMGEGTYEERYANGIKATFEMLEKILAEGGATLDDIVDMTSFHTDLPRQMATILSVRKELMNQPHPAWTAVGTTSLAIPDGQTEIKFTVKLKE